MGMDPRMMMMNPMMMEMMMRRGGMTGPGADPRMMDPRMMDPRMMDPRMMAPGGRPGRRGVTGKEDEEDEKDGAGFVVVIEGYSPYKNIVELMDPFGVSDKQDKWGLVTRLEHLSTILPEYPFELYGKDKIKHFELRTGPVDLILDEMPPGIGVEREVRRVSVDDDTSQGGSRSTLGRSVIRSMRNRMDYVETEDVLFDPLTNEEISKVFDIVTEADITADPELTEKNEGKKKLDDFGKEKYVERDYWFRIKAKFLWKDSPKSELPSTKTSGGR